MDTIYSDLVCALLTSSIVKLLDELILLVREVNLSLNIFYLVEE